MMVFRTSSDDCDILRLCRFDNKPPSKKGDPKQGNDARPQNTASVKFINWFLFLNRDVRFVLVLKGMHSVEFRDDSSWDESQLKRVSVRLQY